MKSLILIGLCLLAGQSHAELRWQQYHGKLPYNAVIGGYEQGRVLYICQAYFNNGLHPGKVVEHRCNIGWGGKEHAIHDFKILVGTAEMLWADRYGIEAMPAVDQFRIRDHIDKTSIYLDDWYPFRGGYENTGTPLVICSAQHFIFQGGVQRHSKGRHPGKIVNGNCNFGYGGDEIVIQGDYMILLVKNQYK